MRLTLPVLLLLAAAPLAAHSAFVLNLATLAAFTALLGQAWNLAGGFGGLLSFGHAAFFGLGAYGAALVQLRLGLPPWVALAGGALVAAAAGAAFGAVVVRAGLRGSAFALVTLAFAEVLRVLANSLDVTGAGAGLHLPLARAAGVLQFADRRVEYATVLALLAAATLAAWGLTRSRFGARLVALRENADAARALGVDPVRTQAAALALSAGFAGAAGGVYAQAYLFVDPSIGFGVERSVEMLLAALVGGPGTVLGPLLGALALHLVGDGSRLLLDTPGVAPMLYGALLLGIVWLLPRGLAGALAHARG